MGESSRVLGGKYAVGRLVASGGMGEVYEAVNLAVGRAVAVKVLRPERAADEVSRSRFLREARAAARVVHEHVCEVYDSGADDGGTLYYVMALLRGEPLSKAIARDAPFPIERAVDVTLQILAALDAAHAAGVVHRDLKPDNVLLTRLGKQDDFVKVLDFGISKVLGEEPAAALTQTDRSLGTPCYMAPEQARSAKSADGRADVYAVGVILYEMLTGRRPVDGASGSEVLWKLWNEPIAAPRAHRPDLPPALEVTVLRALRRDPAERFESAAAFAAALADAAGARVAAAVGAGSASGPSVAHHATGPTVTSDAEPPVEPSLITRTSDAARVRRRRGVVVAVGAATIAAAAAVAMWHSPWAPRPSAPVEEQAAPAAAPSRPAAISPPAGAVSPAVAAPPAGLDTAAGSAPAAAGAPGAGAPMSATGATVDLVGVPAGATITVDGRPLAGTSFSVAHGAGPVEVVVTARGQRQWSRRVGGGSDRTIRVRFAPAAAPGRPPAVRNGDEGVVAGTITDFDRIP